MTMESFLQIASSPVAVGIGSWLVKNALGRQTDRIDRLEKRADKLETDVEAIAEGKVSREDWIRESARVRDRLDQLIVGQARMEERADVAAAFTNAINGLVTTIKGSRNAG